MTEKAEEKEKKKVGNMKYFKYRRHKKGGIYFEIDIGN